MTVPALHLVTPDPVDGRVLASVDAALAAGARWVQVRTKAGTDRQRLEAVLAVRRRTEAAGAVCLVNDRVDLALAAGADGVHLGDGDLPVDAVRRLVPPDFIIGATARDPDGARRAAAAGATYVGVGPVFATTTKAGLPPPLGPEGLARVCASAGLPVIAIAGVTASRVPAVLAAGAAGVAVVGAVFSAPDPAAATAELLAALQAPASDPVVAR
jgi:thiamine-phosphate pyrophosphorylase